MSILIFSITSVIFFISISLQACSIIMFVSFVFTNYLSSLFFFSRFAMFFFNWLSFVFNSLIEATILFWYFSSTYNLLVMSAMVVSANRFGMPLFFKFEIVWDGFPVEPFTLGANSYGLTITWWSGRQGSRSANRRWWCWLLIDCRSVDRLQAGLVGRSVCSPSVAGWATTPCWLIVGRSLGCLLTSCMAVSRQVV